MTCGAYFGLGWIRDLWKLPEYVRDANQDPVFIKHLHKQMQLNPQPPISSVRNFGFIVVADLLGYLVIGALPEELIPLSVRTIIITAFVPLAVAIGIWLVGNVGRHQGNLSGALIGSYLISPAFLWYQNSVFFCSMSSLYFFKRNMTWRPLYKPQSFWKRLVVFTLSILLYSSLWSSWLFFNCTVTDKDDQEIKCRDAAKNFLSSPFWKEFSSVMKDLWNYVSHYGISGLWAELVASLDPSGESNALSVLNLSQDASEEEITSSYRKLARTWHPDRHKDPQAKEEAAQRFMSISKAYEVLSQIKSKRMMKNKRSQAEPNNQSRDEL